MSMRNTTIPYVKFLKGTAEAYKAATVNDNTLYFIYNDDTKTTGTLYLGATKIGGGTTEEVSILVDNISIEKSEENGQISLKNYGKQYYKYDSTSGKYELTEGWVEGLQPKVSANGQLEWYEIDVAINAKINALSDKIDNNTTSILNLDNGLNDRIDARIAANASKVLTFTIVDSVDNIDVNAQDADRYIYLISNGIDYDEYIVVNGTKEKIGSTSVSLEGYATTQYVDEKISGLNTSISQLETTLTNKDAEIVDSISTLNSQIDELRNQCTQNNQNVTTTLASLNSEIAALKVKDSEFNTSLNNLSSAVENILDILTWEELPTT